MDKPRNYLISDVELNWSRLATPANNPFGGVPAWEIQIATTDKNKADELKANNFNVKEKDGKFTVSLRRKSVKADGSAMEPVRVVDANKVPMDNKASIGNGSRGNVIVWQAPYSNMGRSGVSNSLTAVQVVDLVEYSGGDGGVDFDVVSGQSDSAAELF